MKKIYAFQNYENLAWKSQESSCLRFSSHRVTLFVQLFYTLFRSIYFSIVQPSWHWKIETYAWKQKFMEVDKKIPKIFRNLEINFSWILWNIKYFNYLASSCYRVSRGINF